MELWAGGPLGRHADFVMACVESQQVAQQFGHMFKLQHVVNGWVPSGADMPQGYGQLGCSGFVVVAGDGRFLSKKTQAFLQVGEEAFQEVESLLRVHLMSSRDPPSSAGGQGGAATGSSYPYASGCMATIDGLRGDASLNGSRCRVLRFDPSSGRFVVQLLEGGDKRVLAIRPCSLAPCEESNEDEKGENDEASPQDQGQHLAREEEASNGSGVVGERTASGSDDSSELKVISVPASVGVSSMDAEHEACTTAINALLALCPTPSAPRDDSHDNEASPSGDAGNSGSASRKRGLSQDSAEVREKSAQRLAALERVVDELEDHFRHEEALMQSHRFGGGAVGSLSSFSALTGHLQDHERILNLAKREVARVAGAAAGGGAVDNLAAASGYKGYNGVAAAVSSVASSTSSNPATGKGAVVDPSVCRAVALAFTQHASSFDDLYTGHIPISAI